MNETNVSSSQRADVAGHNEPVRQAEKFRGWLEQLEEIHIHYYRKYRRGSNDRFHKESPARRWQQRAGNK